LEKLSFFASRGTSVIANGVIWPLFIFVILGDYVTLGLVGSALALFGALAAWITGRYSDHSNKRTIIRSAAIFNSLSWFLKSIVISTVHVFGATIFGAIAEGVWVAPADAMEYDKAKGDVVGYFVSREIFICLGRIFMLIFVMMIGSLKGGLILQGFASFASFLF